MHAKCLHADIRGHNLVQITNTPIDDQAAPAIGRGLFREHVTQAGPAHTAASIHYHHTPLPLSRHQCFDTTIVFKAFYSDNLATKLLAATEVTQHRLKYPYQIWVLVTEIWGRLQERDALAF